MDKHFVPVLISALTVFVILLARPAFLVKNSQDKDCPYCLNPWLVTLAVIVVGGFSYAFVYQDVTKPSISML